MKKTEIIESLQNLPDEFSFDELMESLLVLHKIELAQVDIKMGKFYTEEEAKQELGKWLN